jgi:RHS repeat-associated protein
MKILNSLKSILWFVLLAGVSFAQVDQAGSVDSQFTQDFGVDSVNLQNLTVNIDVPVISKPGAIPFSYHLLGASACGTVQDGAQLANSYAVCGLGINKQYFYNNSANFSLTGVSPSKRWTIGANPHATTSYCAADGNAAVTTYSGLYVIGPDYQTYHLPSTDKISTESGGSSCAVGLDDYTTQGHVHVIASNLNSVSAVYTADGFTYGAGYVSDPFGNRISGMTDTLGNVAVAVVLNSPGETDTYHDTTGAAQPITSVFGAATTVKTAFGCGTAPNDITTTAQLLSEIDYPDGNNLYFTYEPISGGVTGRLRQITYRTGGTATYTYGAKIACSSLIPSSLSRTTQDGTTTYTVAVFGTGPYGTTTTVLDPGKNKTVYTFMGTGADGTAGAPLTLTQKQVYQNTGTVTSPAYTLLSTTIYCYNGNSTACPTTQAAYPITEKDTYTAPGVKTTYSRTKQLFDTYGNVTSIARYPFVAIGGGTPVETTTITYGSWNGSSCVAVGSGIVNKPCRITTTDNASHTLSDELHNYTAKGFPANVSHWSGSTWITSYASVNAANGTVATTTNPLGLVTTYTYTGGCNGLLPTATSATLGSTTLTTGATWDCNMGKLMSSIDENSHTSNFTYDLFGRPYSQTDPSGLYELDERYPSATSSTLTDSTYFTTTNTVDGLGRPIRSQTTDGASYDTVSSAYAFTTGTNPQFQVSTSQPCIATLGADCTKNHFGKVDPLGRPISSSTTSNETGATSYNQNDISFTLSPAPSGENNKTVQTEYDGLGRVISTCALQTTGGTACGQVDGNSGILTTFAYSSGPWSRTVTATRGSQVHTTIYDALGRVRSVTTPEAGTTTYVYDTATAMCGSGVAPGTLVETIDNAGTHMCFGIDAIGRTFQAHDPTYSQGCHSWVFGDQYSGTPNVSNANLRLAEAYTDSNCSGASKITDEYFSYDKDGRATDVWETTPHSGGQYHTQANYAVNGALASISGVPGKSTYTIGLDPNGRPDTSTYGATPVATNVTYNGAGQTKRIDYGADSDVFGYSADTGLMNNFTYTLGTTTYVGTPLWNANRTLKKLTIVDGFNATDSQTCNFNPTDHAGTGYDDVGRLIGTYCGAVWNQTYSYDQYDNFSKSGTTNWNPGYNSTATCPTGTICNHITGAGYDSDGQVTYDLNNSFAWDGYHKMITANSGPSLGSCGGAGVVCLTYDALGRAVEKNLGGTFTEYLYSPAGLTAIMSGQTANAFRAPIPGGAIFTSNSTGNIVSHLDWLGSSRLSATLGHAVSRDTAYSPYGEDYASTGTGIVQEFAGMFTDHDTNVLFDTPNRQFDVSSGSRWLSPDPARASWNAYSYPTNPNSATDPTGLEQREQGANEFGNTYGGAPDYDEILTGICSSAECAAVPEPGGEWSADAANTWVNSVNSSLDALTSASYTYSADVNTGPSSVTFNPDLPASGPNPTLNILAITFDTSYRVAGVGLANFEMSSMVGGFSAHGSPEFQGLKFSRGTFSNRGTMTLEEATDVFGPPTHSSPVTDSWDVPGAKNITHYWDRPDLGGYYRLSNHYGQVGKSNWGLGGVVPPGAGYTHFGDTLYLGFAKYVDLTPIP